MVLTAARFLENSSPDVSLDESMWNTVAPEHTPASRPAPASVGDSGEAGLDAQPKFAEVMCATGTVLVGGGASSRGLILRGCSALAAGARTLATAGLAMGAACAAADEAPIAPSVERGGRNQCTVAARCSSSRQDAASSCHVCTCAWTPCISARRASSTCKRRASLSATKSRAQVSTDS